jgi:hypothetical protein
MDAAAQGWSAGMIRYDLICACGHRFDAWFSSSAAYDEQRQAGLVECPLCGGTDVRKQLMTPALASGASRQQRKEPRQTARLNDETARAARALLRALHAHQGAQFGSLGRLLIAQRDQLLNIVIGPHVRAIF